MQIVTLRIKNFLSIADAELKPGQVNQICGKNNQGKTTVLRAIEAALTGSTDGTLVKRGEDESEIILELDNGLSVERRITADGKQSVTVKEGERQIQKPQTFLDTLFSSHAFNPLDLLDPKRRTEALLQAIPIRIEGPDLIQAVGEDCPVDLPPLDYEQHGLKVAEQAHAYFYQRRAEANKDAKAKAERFRVQREELPPMPEQNDPRSESDLRTEIEEAHAGIYAEEAKRAVQTERRKKHSALMGQIAELDQRISGTQDLINQLEQQLAAAKSRQTANQETRRQLQAAQEKALLEIDGDGPDAARLTDLNATIQDLQTELTRRAEINALKERHSKVEALREEMKAAEAFHAKLDQVVGRLGKKFRAELMAKAELPVPGLSYEDGQFFLDGASIDNLAASKALRLAVAIARKLSGKMKLICLDGAELLDEATYQALRKEIDGDGFTYFLTKVGDPFPHPTDRVTVMKNGTARAG